MAARRTARQRAASRKNLEKARAAKAKAAKYKGATPYGKSATIQLYKGAFKDKAQKLLTGQQISRQPGDPKFSFWTTDRSRAASYGTTVVQGTFKRRKVTHHTKDDFLVPDKNLVGVKVRRSHRARKRLS